MGRKVEIVTVPEWGGRDAGKKFEITETDAVRAEKWFWRLVIAVKGTSAQIPEELAPHGMVVLAIRGINSFLASDVDFAKLDPLLDELLACVKIVRDQRAVDKTTGRLLATGLVSSDDIEEVKTIMWLRSEVLRIHTNFSFTESVLSWVSTLTKLSEASGITSTSPGLSATSSPETSPFSGP